jgi:hypothetical protein
VAKRPALPAEIEYHERVFLPAVRAAGSLIEDLGELSGAERDRVIGGSHALLMPGTWPEPFGLTAIEALACGTPVLARRVGALPEIVREGIDGFFGDDVDHLAFLVDRVAGLDRTAIRDSVLDRFSAGRMTDDYEAIYRRTIARTALDRASLNLALRAPLAVGPGRAPVVDDVPDPDTPIAVSHDESVKPLRAVADRIAAIEAGRSRD